MTLNSQNHFFQKSSTLLKIEHLMPADYCTPSKIIHKVFISHSLERNIDMQRILVLGSSGSGKSTLARRLGAILELPVIHLDRHFWHPGWVSTPWDEWTNTVQGMVTRKQWIMDGNYRRSLDIRLGAADTAVFLDLPQWLCVYRAIKRRIQYMNSPRPDIAVGCQERIFDPNFPQFIRHIFEYPNRARPSVKNQLAQLPQDKKVIWLQSTTEVAQFLQDPLNPRFVKRPEFNMLLSNSVYTSNEMG
jgi:adenylate kinase family enzyme